MKKKENKLGQIIILVILLVIVGIMAYPDIKYDSITTYEDYNEKRIIKIDKKGNEHIKIIPKKYYSENL